MLADIFHVEKIRQLGKFFKRARYAAPCGVVIQKTPDKLQHFRLAPDAPVAAPVPPQRAPEHLVDDFS